MRFIFLNLFVVMLAGNAQAKEGAAAPEGGEAKAGEAKAEGGKEGGSKKRDEFTKKVTELNTHEAKIDGLKKEIQGQLEEMQHVEDHNRQAEIGASIGKLHKDLAKQVDEYNKIREELKYRFPAQGDLTERRYAPLRTQSVSEIGKEMGLEAALSRFKNKVAQKYETFTHEDKPPVVAPLPRAPASEEEPKRLRLER